MPYVDPEVCSIDTRGLRIDTVVFDEHGLTEEMASVMLGSNTCDDLVAGKHDRSGQDVGMIGRVECMDEMAECDGVMMCGGGVPVRRTSVG